MSKPPGIPLNRWSTVKYNKFVKRDKNTKNLQRRVCINTSKISWGDSLSLFFDFDFPPSAAQDYFLGGWVHRLGTVEAPVYSVWHRYPLKTRVDRKVIEHWTNVALYIPFSMISWTWWLFYRYQLFTGFQATSYVVGSALSLQAAC